ncbi:MAG: response regulator transcription factor [Rubrivivax sp.]|jgi:DNA-binding NarL/FixJ family response regulator|nr:response regulator transcription factor [Rubrivivax sp.]
MNVLIADDHPLVRDALAHTLGQVAPGAQVLQAGDYASAEALLAAHDFALALLDLHMPGMDPTNRMEGLRRLHARFPTVPLVVASGDDDPAVIRATFAAGAVAFLPKSEPAQVLQQALRLVLGGGSYMPRQALSDWSQGVPPPQPDISVLTPRQMDVLRCLMQGQPNKLIARELGLTEGTVKIHIAAILRALRSRNRTEAVVVARDLGLGG